MKKIIIFVVLAALLYSPSLLASENTPEVGVWVTVFSTEKVHYSKEAVDALIETCRQTGINNIYLQVYRSGEAYYNSDKFANTPYKKMLNEAGLDTIGYLLKKANENSINVYAWINVLSLGRNKNADIIKKYGPGVITVDQYNRSSFVGKKKDKLDKYYIRENQIFLEPGDWRVRQYVADIAEEVIKKYPSFAGIHLDYIRYPAAVPFIPGSRFTSHGISYGYGKLNTDNFRDKTGLEVNNMEPIRKNFEAWDKWRRDQVTHLVSNISISLRKINPSIKISATTVPSIERSYLTTLQDWTEWLKNGYVDYMVIMNYTDDPQLFKMNSECFLNSPLRNKIHMGVASYLMKEDPEKMKEEFEYLEKASPEGIVIFSYDDMQDPANQELIKNFKNSSSQGQLSQASQ